MQTKSNTATLVITGLASACLFGAATPASKALLGETQAQALAGLLYLGAALGVMPLVIRERSFGWPWRTGGTRGTGGTFGTCGTCGTCGARFTC